MQRIFNTNLIDYLQMAKYGVQLLKEATQPEVRIANLPNLLRLFHLSVRSRMPILVEIGQRLSNKWQRIECTQVRGPAGMVAVSPYFNRSMIHANEAVANVSKLMFLPVN